jgi:hypothetical protein
VETPEDVDVPIRALITLCNPGVTDSEGPSALAAAPTASLGLQVIDSCLEGPFPASAIADSPAREVRPTEPIAVSSAVADSPAREVRPTEPIAVSSAVASVKPTAAPSAVAPPSGGAIYAASTATAHSSEGTPSREPIAPSLAIAASFSRQVHLLFVAILVFFVMPVSLSSPSEPGSFGAPCV